MFCAIIIFDYNIFFSFLFHVMAFPYNMLNKEINKLLCGMFETTFIFYFTIEMG